MSRCAALLALALAAACAQDGRPVSELGSGQVSFDVTFDPASYAGHQGQHARRCLRQDYVESGMTRQTRPPQLFATTAAATTVAQNRELHRCLLVISSAAVSVTPGPARSGAYESELVIEYDQ